MTAMILAAGRGERLRPLTDHTPKPLIEVGSKSIIEHHLAKLSRLGFSDVVINIDHLGKQFLDYLGDGSKWGVEICYSDERQSGGLESLGGIVNALGLIKSETFLVVNGDVMSNYEFDLTLDLQSLAHLILVPNPPHNPNGDFGIDDGLATNERSYTFSGIGYYHRSMFENKSAQKAPLAPLLREQIDLGNITASLYNGEWIDVGTQGRLKEACAIFG